MSAWGQALAMAMRIRRTLRLGAEVEAGEIPRERELRQPEAHVDAPLVLPGDHALAEEGQRLAHRHLAPRSLVDQAVELLEDRGQLQPGQHSLEVIVDNEGHHQAPPAAASYSASGRSSAGAAAASGASGARTTRATRTARLSAPAQFADALGAIWTLSIVGARTPAGQADPDWVDVLVMPAGARATALAAARALDLLRGTDVAGEVDARKRRMGCGGNCRVRDSGASPVVTSAAQRERQLQAGG